MDMDNGQTEQFNACTTLMGMCLRIMELLQTVQSVIRFGVSGAAGQSVGCLLIIMNACGMLCYSHSDVAVVMLDMWYAVDVRCVMFFGICCLN
jgi:Na+/serine symporter